MANVSRSWSDADGKDLSFITVQVNDINSLIVVTAKNLFFLK